jgi:DNA-binding transcriptional ArsR family regulator
MKTTRTDMPSKVRARSKEMGKPPTDRTTAIKAIGENLPRRAPQRGNSPAIAEKILTLMRRNPKRCWTTSGLAHKFGKSIKAMRHLTSDMRERGLIALVDEGRRLWALREAGIPTRKTVSGRIIEKLIAVEEMRYSVLARAIGVDPPAMSAPLRSLRRNNVLEAATRHPDTNKRPPLRLSADARAKIERGEVIRDRRRSILWAPADAGQK